MNSKHLRKTILATALLAATSMAFAADKPTSPPAGGAPATQPAPDAHGQATSTRAQANGTDAAARDTFGADTAEAAQVRNEAGTPDDPVDDGEEVIVPDDPIEDGDDDDDIIDADQDGDGIPDDDDGDDDGDGEIDQFDPQPANSFGQDTSDAAQADDREAGVGNRDAAHARNDLRAQDTDGDGSNDYLDTDDDGDGITDSEELDEDDDDGPVDDGTGG